MPVLRVARIVNAIDVQKNATAKMAVSRVRPLPTPARRKQVATATTRTANAKRTTLRPLQQNGTDQNNGDDKVNDEEKVLHGNSKVVAGALALKWGRGKRPARAAQVSRL